MKSSTFLESIVPLWSHYVRTGLVSGRDIDDGFISRGFSGVRAEIDYKNDAYGAATYDVDLGVHASAESFKDYRSLEKELYEWLDEVDGLPPGGARDEAWDRVLRDQRLPSFLKGDALSSIDKVRYDAMLETYAPAMRDAIVAERENVCRLVPLPGVSLLDDSTVELRKEALNQCMLDAYGALGFQIFKAKKGVRSYIKDLGNGCAIIIEPDVLSLQSKYRKAILPAGVYWPLLAYDRWCWLSSVTSKHTDRSPLVTEIHCASAWRKSRYEDTRSLEAMVRADALWYELTLAPFEKCLIEHCQSVGM